MISSSSNIDNNCLNSTKDSKNQIKEEKVEFSSKTDFKNFPILPHPGRHIALLFGVGADTYRQ